MVPFWTPRGALFDSKLATLSELWELGCVSGPFVVDLFDFLGKSSKITPKMSPNDIIFGLWGSFWWPPGSIFDQILVCKTPRPTKKTQPNNPTTKQPHHHPQPHNPTPHPPSTPLNPARRNARSD